MNPETLRRIAEYGKKRRRRSVWKKAVSVLAAIVVFCTTYALILPAITLEQDTYCGMVEHVHEDACYTKDETAENADTVTCADEMHEHTARCYGTWTLTCGELVHSHTDTCYVDADTLKQVDRVVAAIEALPTPEEIDSELAAIEAQRDWPLYESTYQGYQQQSRYAYELYAMLNAESQALVSNVDRLTALEYLWGSYVMNDAMAIATERLEAFTNGSLVFSYNDTKDAFLTDPAYAQFYNENSPLGTAGSFHIVAFDTAHLYVHTNGNVLAKNLIASSNFGTNSKNGYNLIELSYVQNYLTVNANSGADTEDYLVIGSSNTVGTADNGNALTIDGTKMDKPKNIIQDSDTASAPFIDLVRVEAEAKTVSQNLTAYQTSDSSLLSVTTTGEAPALELMDKDGIAFYNITAADLTTITNHGRGLAMKGFASDGNGAIIVNVDCAAWDPTKTLVLPNSYVWVDGEQQGLTETVDFSAGHVIWNFVNAAGMKIETAMMTGMILAPESDIDLNKSFNGTAIGQNVENHSETHRTDFVGSIFPDTDVDSAHIYIHKVDGDNYGTYLSGAEFALYEWNGSEWIAAVGDDGKTRIDVTDDTGCVLFADLTFNVAYKMVETKAPVGYTVSEDSLYFFFESSDVSSYPIKKPPDFSGESVDKHFVHFWPNEAADIEMTTLTVKKQWATSDGSTLESIPWDSISFEIRVTQSEGTADADGNITYGPPGEATLYGTYTVSAAEYWFTTVTDLPVTSADRLIRYDYTVRETAMNGCESEVTVSDDGTVTITNTVTVTKEYATLKINKEWVDVGEEVSEASFEVWQVSRTDPNGAWGTPERVMDQVLVDALSGWSWTSGDTVLLAEKTVGDVTTYYAYYVVETPVPEGTVPDYGGVDADSPVTENENWEITVKNIGVQTTSLTVTKQWKDALSSTLAEPPTDAVDVRILQSSDGGITWTEYDTCSVTAAEQWTLTVTGLPQSDPSQNLEFIYRVEEIEVSGFLSETVQTDDNTFVITNTEKGDMTAVTVEKQWFKDGTLIAHNSGAVTVELYRVLSSSADGGTSSSETATVGIYIDQWYTSGSGALYKNTVTVPIGGTITFVMISSNQTPTLAYGDAATSWNTTTIAPTSTVTDTSSGSTLYRVTYEYTVTGNIDLLGYVSVNDTQNCQFELSTTGQEPEETLADTVVLSPDNAWKHRFYGLPLYEYDDSGAVVGYYTYFVKEVNGETFNVLYTDPNGDPVNKDSPVSGGTVLIKNTVPDDAYTLPETGGIGIPPYIAVGAALILIGVAGLMYILQNSRKKEGVSDL